MAQALRPLGYALWGAAWAIIAAAVTGMGIMLVVAVAQGPARPGLEWLLFVPIVAWLCVVFPFALWGQAALGFTAAVMALRARYSETRLTDAVGVGSHRVLEARVDTPLLRVITAVSNLGFTPGWMFYFSAVAITGGVGALAQGFAFEGWVLLVAGLAGAAYSIPPRFMRSLRQRTQTGDERLGLTPKYYKGLAQREAKRARALQKARDAGRADPAAFDAWVAAEVAHAMRSHPMAVAEARRGVPGALDPIIDDVVEALDGRVSRTEAIQHVRTGATYRGTKPDYLPAPGAKLGDPDTNSR